MYQNFKKAIVVAFVSLSLIMLGGFSAVQAAEKNPCGKGVAAHAREGVKHLKEAIKHLEEAVKAGGNAHVKEALEHAKEALKHAEEGEPVNPAAKNPCGMKNPCGKK
ncbi:MAG: hypothetical protein HY266_00975 [Deltaproteobacteria bacterium]|nr:hypothetical protein [Deltaproteobacteria bacterium]